MSTPLSGDFRNNDSVNFDLYYFSYILYYVVNNKLGGLDGQFERSNECYAPTVGEYD